MAAFLLNVVLSRIVNTQREQIAALRAFGYSQFQIGMHYLKLVFLLVFVGWVIGTAAGAYLGDEMTGMYAMFFRFPLFDYHSIWRVASGALVVAGFGGNVGGAWRRFARGHHAAGRSDAPRTARPSISGTILERLGLSRFISPSMRMVSA